MKLNQQTGRNAVPGGAMDGPMSASHGVAPLRPVASVNAAVAASWAAFVSAVPMRTAPPENIIELDPVTVMPVGTPTWPPVTCVAPVLVTPAFPRIAKLELAPRSSAAVAAADVDIGAQPSATAHQSTARACPRASDLDVVSKRRTIVPSEALKAPIMI